MATVRRWESARGTMRAGGPVLLLLALLGCGGDDGGEATDGASPTASDADGDGHDAPADCDDADNTVFPGAPERCNDADDDCDGLVDEGFDLDEDGFPTELDPGCASLGIALDCDDGDPAVFPGATEQCNGVDDDCDGLIDPEIDGDGDGALLCDDCDDGDASVLPGAPELCDGVDNDCNGISDDPFDADGDGWGDCLDCDDDEVLAHPGGVEVCDAVDNDCDGEIDEDFDLDGDGFSTCRGDCDDNDALAHPWEPEICDGVDNDCNGTVDDVDDLDGDGFVACGATPDCDDADPGVNPGMPELCNGVDDDCDGLLLPDEVDADGDLVLVCDGDCDDGDPTRAPGLLEVCDGVDNDCDPATVDDGDADGDGLTPCDGDCDDTEPLAAPGGVEVCNGVDDDCNGTVDDGNVCGPCEGYVFDGHTYLFCDAPSSWDDARLSCTSYGYDLATVGDSAENVWLTDQAAALDGGTWWIGLNDRTTEGIWAWTSGEPVAYTSWEPGQPNDFNGQDCVEINWAGYQWNDAACTDASPFVCESL